MWSAAGGSWPARQQARGQATRVVPVARMVLAVGAEVGAEAGAEVGAECRVEAEAARVATLATAAAAETRTATGRLALAPTTASATEQQMERCWAEESAVAASGQPAAARQS